MVRAEMGGDPFRWPQTVERAEAVVEQLEKRIENATLADVDDLVSELEKLRDSRYFELGSYLKDFFDLISKVDNYWVRLRLTQTITPPLENAPEWLKRMLLRDYGFGYDEVSNSFDYRGEADGPNLVNAFRVWRRKDPRYLRDFEHQYFFQGYYTKLASQYDVAIHLPPDIKESQVETFKQQCVFSKLSSEFGVVYNPDARVNTVFRLNADMDADTVPKEKIKAEIIQFDEEIDRAVSVVLSEEDRVRLKNSYRTLVDLSVRKDIEQEFGIHLEELSFKEQLFFLDFLQTANDQTVKRVTTLIRNFGRDGIRAFLSLEFGQEMGHKILELSEGLNVEDVKSIFDRYGEIIKFAQTEAGVLLDEFFVKGKGVPVDSAKIEMELLGRAKRVIEDFAKEAMAAKATGIKLDSAELLKKLEQANADTVLFTSIFKAAFKGKKGVEFKDVQGMEFETLSPQDVSEKDRTAILAISDANWQEVPSMRAFIAEMTKAKLEQPSNKTVWSVLKQNSKVVAFGRFDELPDGSLYAGSFNVAPGYRGSAIGDALFQNTFDVKAKDHVIHANVYPDSDVASAYVEEYGFVITDVEDVLLPGGGREVGFKITRDDSRKGEYSRSVPSSRYDLATDKDRLLSDIRNAKNRGEVVTRFVVDHENPRVRLVTFEKQAELRTPLTSLAQTG